MSATFVTVDYDFFIPHGMYEDVKMPDGSIMPGMLVYDWQMNEGRNPDFDMVIWRSRAAGFTRMKMDIKKLTAPTMTSGYFASELTMRMGDYGGPLLWRGDSHAWAGLVARDFSKRYGPLSVVNFDAHHDLGYGPKPLAQFQKTDAISCENWALIGLSEGWIKNYTIVYPDWLGMKEWNKPARKYAKRISATQWSDWDAELEEVEAMYFCRSSSWTPPWLDSGFEELHDEFGYADCIDCQLGQSNSPYDTCKARTWDWEAVEREEKLLMEMRERLFDKTSAGM